MSPNEHANNKSLLNGSPFSTNSIVLLSCQSFIQWLLCHRRRFDTPSCIKRLSYLSCVYCLTLIGTFIYHCHNLPQINKLAKKSNDATIPRNPNIIKKPNVSIVPNVSTGGLSGNLPTPIRALRTSFIKIKDYS